MIIATLYKVTIKFVNDEHVSPWTFASLAGAKAFCEDHASEGNVEWYSIEGQEYRPCGNEYDQLYIGLSHMEFVDVKYSI